MAGKRSRKTRIGNGDVAKAATLKRKEKRAAKQALLEADGKGGFPKRKPAYDRPEQLRTLVLVDQNRWPDDDQLQKYAELNQDKKRRGVIKKAKKPRVDHFPLMDELDPVTRNRMLIAASLKLQPVKRQPGFVLTRTYNHKQRPITFV